MSLRWKILLYWSALLVALIAAVLVYVSFQAKSFVNEQIANNLEQTRQRIAAAEDERLGDLRLMARLIASFPSLKALLTTDIATIRDFLLAYQQENRRSELLIVLDPEGRVVARTDTTRPLALPDARARWIEPILAGQLPQGVLETESGVYDVVAVPADAAGTIFGYVLAGAGIDGAYARALGNVSRAYVLLLGEQTLGSSLPEKSWPWRSRQEWETEVGTDTGPLTVKAEGETYAAIVQALGSEGGPRPLAIVLQSQDQAVAPYVRIQIFLVILGIVAAIAGISVSAVLTRTITAPVAQLVEGTKQVAAGNFDFRLDLRQKDEIGILGQAFNSMIQGLRERAAMQKFVSHSTMEMIRTSLGKDPSAGERVHLTILLSDIRGFTAMAERQPPEAVVSMLNCCLGLQAAIVKKFRGDIDKYMGDSLMALFSGEEMVFDAVCCAGEIHSALDAYNVANRGSEPVQVGIAIVTGDVILGSIGSPERQDFTVVGSNVNLCARLCDIARPREILMSESAYLQVKDRIAAAPLEPVSVKGFHDPIQVYSKILN